MTADRSLTAGKLRLTPAESHLMRGGLNLTGAELRLTEVGLRLTTERLNRMEVRLRRRARKPPLPFAEALDQSLSALAFGLSEDPNAPRYIHILKPFR